MTLIIALAIASAAMIVGVGLGWFLRFITALGRKGSMELEIKEMLLAAREKADKVVAKADEVAQRTITELKKEVKSEEEKLEKTEERLVKKEELLDQRQIDLDDEDEKLKSKEDAIEKELAHIAELEEKKIEELKKITHLSEDEARDELIRELEKKYEEDITARLRKIEIDGKNKYEDRARNILVNTIQRLSTSVSADTFSSVVSLPNEEIKGKIIGKEGRNIKTFERETGTELIIDDTPETIVISCFDPVRRHIAQLALEELIKDGRIQPAKIEETIKKTHENVNEIIREQGEKAAYDCKIYNVDPRILILLGRLYFRTSYGQNVLQHSIEVSHLCAMIAEEVGADVQVARTAGLLHDIGKAVDHEVAGTHVDIGRRILQKFGIDESIIKAMQAHHEEYPFETVESVIVQVADRISGGRPGARQDNIENYLKRLEELEAVANGFEGVERSYALQAGREIRIFVEPQRVSDLEAKKLAQSIAKRIENELAYPGEIKVTVIRETKIIDFAR